MKLKAKSYQDSDEQVAVLVVSFCGVWTSSFFGIVLSRVDRPNKNKLNKFH